MPIANKEVCYEYFKCNELDCSRRKSLTTNCWDVDDVECHTHNEYVDSIRDKFKTKLEACKLCIFYKKYNN